MQIFELEKVAADTDAGRRTRPDVPALNAQLVTTGRCAERL